jgi:hypothetical protein
MAEGAGSATLPEETEADFLTAMREHRREVGPAEVADMQIRARRKRGGKSVRAKMKDKMLKVEVRSGFGCSTHTCVRSPLKLVPFLCHARAYP